MTNYRTCYCHKPSHFTCNECKSLLNRSPIMPRLNPDCTCNYGDHTQATCPSCEYANLDAVEQAEQLELDLEKEHREATDLIYYPTYSRV